jgi:hypothetical protein
MLRAIPDSARKFLQPGNQDDQSVDSFSLTDRIDMNMLHRLWSKAFQERP